MSFPELATERLLLKELTVNDRNAIFEIFSNSDVVNYYDLAEFKNLNQADNLIHFFNNRYQTDAGIRWGIFLKNEPQCIGTCGFNAFNNAMHSTTIGYDLNKYFWGMGIATEALHAVLNYLFSAELPFGMINRVQADTVPGNIASEKVLLKLGFKEEGLRRKSGFWKNQYHDLKCFGLLKSDFVTQTDKHE